MGSMYTDVENYIRTLVTTILKKDQTISKNEDIVALGFNSLNAVFLIAQCESTFDIDIEPEDMVPANLETPALFASLLVTKYKVDNVP